MATRDLATGPGSASSDANSTWMIAWRRFRRHRLAMFSLLVLGLFALASLLVPLFVTERQSNRINLANSLQPPSMQHPFGTDDIGRDIMQRAVFGGRVSLRIGLLAALVAVLIGSTVGAVAAFYGGWVDNVLMRITDAFLSIPNLFFLIIAAKLFGQSILVITLVIGALSWMGVGRIVRANILSLKEQEFVTAAHALGARSASVITKYLIPNTIGPIVVAATLGVGQAILLEATLSFLGLGLQPPTASWGTMLQRAQGFLVTAPWVAFFPGSLILITVVCVNFIGEGLRDALDPHSRE
jgi:peptide/nickel transport system permease protein